MRLTTTVDTNDRKRCQHVSQLNTSVVMTEINYLHVIVTILDNNSHCVTIIKPQTETIPLAS